MHFQKKKNPKHLIIVNGVSIWVLACSKISSDHLISINWRNGANGCLPTHSHRIDS
jgi:hypothetical protein